MNARAAGGIVRLLLGAAAVASAGAAVTVTLSAPEDPRAPEIAVRADPVPPMPTAVAPKKRAPTPPAGAAELLLFLHPGTAPAAYAREHGLVHLHTLRSDKDAHVFAAGDPSALKAHRGRVRKAFLNERLQRVHCAFVPDDPYYDNDNNPAGFPGQWHLGNGATATHANVVAAWNRDVTGAGVLIGIVDDCLEIAHPDLGPNHSAADSWDFGQNDADPSPVYNNPVSTQDRHGTSVGGVAAARGGNGIGVTGAAPLASLAGLRIDFKNQTTQMFVDATLYHSSGGNTAIKVKNHSYGYSTPFVDSQAERDAVETSALAGTIHLFAAGNERGAVGEDSNKSDVQSSPHVIAVAAIGSNGVFSSYSSFGANVFITAPSNTSGGFGILTVDRTGSQGYNRTGGDSDPFTDLNYTSTFGGTSSATPLAAGIVALAKQVQPALNVRFAKHLLVRSSALVDPNDLTVTGGGDGVTAGSAWKTNAAGFRFNENYGFGMIDADALTQQAVLYSGFTALQTVTTGPVAVAGGAIPDNDATGITRTFPIVATTPLEEMLVTLAATHTYRGDLEAYLTSPAGTVSRLFLVRGGDGAPNLNWTFVSNAFWGENPAGTWTIRVRDVAPVDTGTWTSFEAVARMGQIIPNATPPQVTSVTRAGASPTNAASVDFTVLFSENVTGVGAADFALTTTGGIGGAAVTGVSGGGSLYTVTVSTGSGSGTLRLDVLDDDTIVDGGANPLAGPFSAGQVYTIDKTAPAVARVTSTTLNGTYGSGAPINVTVDFTEPVTLAGGSLRVTLSTGDLVSFAPFTALTTVSGTYTVGAGDNSPDLDSTSPLTLSAGTLRDAAGNACVLTIPGGQTLAALKNLVVDTTAPSVARVTSSTLNGTYGTGAAIGVTVDFTEPVTLAGGNLRVTLSTGDIVTILPFGPAATVSGNYTVSAGDNALDLDAASPLTLSAGTLRDAVGLDAALAVPGGQNLADLKDLVIDTTGPTVTINQAAVQADPTNASPVRFTVVFSESVTGFVDGDVTLGGTAGATTQLVTGSGTTYTVEVTGMTGTGTVTASIAAGRAVDSVGNANSASTSTDATVTYDITPPTVTINKSAGQADPTGASPISFTVVFSSPVTGFDTGDVTLGGTAGATLGSVSGGPSTYTVLVSGMTSDGTVIATVAAGVATDTAGNGNLASTSTDNSVLFDATAPSVTINQAAGQSDPTSGTSIFFTVVFSETVTGFANGDVTLGGTAGATTAAVTGGGTTYTVEVSGMTATGTVTASIAAGVAIDATSNPNLASTSSDNVVTYDGSVPTVTINQAAGQADPTNGTSIVYDVVFSQSVINFATGDVTLGGTAGATTAIVAGSGTTYTVTVSGMAGSGTVIASIPAGVATSATLVPNAASTSGDNTVTYDVTGPTVTINQAAGQADPTGTSPINFTVLFSEPVTTFATGDVTLGGTAGATTALVSGSGTTYTVAVSGMTGSGTVTASIAAGAAPDGLGNLNAGSTSGDNTVTYDVTPPTVTINQAAGQADPTNGATINFTALFSKSVTGFDTGDVSFGGSTVGGVLVGTVTGGPTTFNVAVTGMTTGGVVVASVPAGVAVDGLGNANAASTSTDATVTRDVTPPTVTINQAAGQADPTNAGPINFTVVFSKPVTGFVDGEVVLSGSAGATTATVSGTGTTYNVAVSGMTGSGTVVASIAAGVAADAAGNGNLASTSSDATVTYDVVPLTVTIDQAAGQPDPASGSSILYTVVFNKAVTTFATGDVTLGGTAGAATAIVAGSGTTYTVTVGGMSSDGTVTASIGAGVATDAAGNANLASTSGDNAVAYDGTAPTVTVNQAAGQADPTSSSPILFTAVFSEPVTSPSVTVGGTPGGTAAVSGGPTTWTIGVSGMTGDGKVTVTLAAGAATDAAGNPSEASTSADNSVSYDATPPVVADVTSTTPDGAYGPGAAIAVTVLFDEPVTVTGVPRLELATAVVDYAGGTGTTTLLFTYTVLAGHVSPDLDYLATTSLSLNGGTIRDLAGNDAALTLAAPGAPGSLGANKALVVDGSPPLGGTVSDGWAGADVDVQLSRTTIAAHWSGFSDAESGIAGYEWAIGTTAGGQEVRAFAPVGLRTSASTSAENVLLAPPTGIPYFVTVRATNGADGTVSVSSDGVTVTGTDAAGPAAPAAFLAIPSDGSAILEWLPSPSADVSFYRLWWKPAADPWSAATLVDGLAGPTTTVLGLSNGTLYDFMLKASDGSENESAGVFASCTPMPAIRIGGVSYGSVQAALDAAQPGETVELGPGTYVGALTIPPGVSLSGISAGHTHLVGTPGLPVVTVLGLFGTDGTSTIGDLTITTGTVGVAGGSADVLLDHVIIHHVTSHGASSGALGRLAAVNVTVMSNGGDGLVALGAASVRNGIVGRNGGTGVNMPGGSSVTYTMAFANTSADFAAGVAGAGNRTVAAVFVNEAADDYLEDPSSPSVDGGDPADPFAAEPAPNGSRINGGAFGGTGWAASAGPGAPPVGGGGGGGGGGGCGATGLEGVIVAGFVWGLRRRKRKSQNPNPKSQHPTRTAAAGW